MDDNVNKTCNSCLPWFFRRRWLAMRDIIAIEFISLGTCLLLIIS